MKKQVLLFANGMAGKEKNKKEPEGPGHWVTESPGHEIKCFDLILRPLFTEV